MSHIVLIVAVCNSLGQRTTLGCVEEHPFVNKYLNNQQKSKGKPSATNSTFHFSLAFINTQIHNKYLFR